MKPSFEKVVVPAGGVVAPVPPAPARLSVRVALPSGKGDAARLPLGLSRAPWTRD